MRRADDHDILRDDRRGMQPDFAGDGIDRLIVILFQIDHAILSEAGHGNAGLGVQGNQTIAGRDVEDALFFCAAFRPVGESAAGELPRGVCAARAFVFTVGPQQFTGGGVDCDHSAARSHGRIEDALRHERRALQIEFRTRDRGSRS